MSKLNISVVIIIGILLFSSISSGVLLYKERKKTSKLENNIQLGYETGFKIVDYYKAKNGQLVARNAVLEYSSKQLSQAISSEIIAHLENLGIKPKNVNYYSETVINHEREIITPVRDSVVYDTIKAECFSFVDQFTDISGCRVGDSQKLKLSFSDSIIQVVYKGSRINRKGKKVPGICFWHPRILEQSIVSSNPYSKIIYSKTVLVSK